MKLKIIFLNDLYILFKILDLILLSNCFQQKSISNNKNSETDSNYFCGTVDEPLLPVYPIMRRKGETPMFGNLTFKVSIYYDKILLLKHHNDLKKLYHYIYANINSVSLTYNQNRLRDLAQFSISVMQISPVPHNVRINNENDGTTYRRNFCAAVRNENRGLMSAILFTGHNIRTKDANLTSTQGLAHLRVACNWDVLSIDPCIIVEAKSFKTAYILAHELGHTLGINHDEVSSCGSSDIMSNETGPGKTKFSKCSVSQMSNYFSDLKKTKHWCFDYNQSNSVNFFPSISNPPKSYQSLSVDEQCMIAFGESFRQYLYNDYHNICWLVWCTNGIIAFPSNPALENTPCGYRRVCREGKCTFI